LESAELIIDGEISSCIYSDKAVNTGSSFISKIFK